MPRPTIVNVDGFEFVLEPESTEVEVYCDAEHIDNYTFCYDAPIYLEKSAREYLAEQ